MITITIREAITELKKTRKIKASYEDILDKILDNSIRTREIDGEWRVSYNDVMYVFNPAIFTIVSAKEKRKAFVQVNYKALWDREMIGSFEDEEDDFEGLYSEYNPNYECELWSMRSRKVYLKEEESYEKNN